MITQTIQGAGRADHSLFAVDVRKQIVMMAPENLLGSKKLVKNSFSRVESPPIRTMSHAPRKTRLPWWILLVIVVFLTQHVVRWGLPVKTNYTLANESASVQREWVIHRNGNQLETWLARDRDGDGRIDEFETPQGVWKRTTQPKRWLIVCLDGVPLAEMQRLWEEGHFREFSRPRALISTFPSDSETALTAVLHASPVPGYEHRYFDVAHNELRGGAWMTLTGKSSPYLELLDYDEPGIFKGLHYILRRKTYRADLGRLVERFRRSRPRVFVAHLASTDALYHVLKPVEVRSLLLEFEAVIREFYLDARGELGVLLFSDHGNTLRPSRTIPLDSALRSHGWRPSGRLERPRDVAVPPYGLIGFLAVYCREEAVPQLARDLTEVEGVDLVAYRDARRDSVWILNGSGARARLRWSADGGRYWYDAQSGDPLELIPIYAKLRSEGWVAEDGSAGDADLLAATASARYPDASQRIREWATNHVRNRSDIAVSLKPGYFYGSGLFQHIVRLESTHGALEASSSLGFAMTTAEPRVAARLPDLLPRDTIQRGTDRAP